MRYGGASEMKEPADGYPTVLRSWGDLAKALEHFSKYNGRDWLFRGVTNASHGLVPKVGRQRTKQTKVPSVYGYDKEHEEAVLRLFKQQATAFVAGERSELEWMALAQHFGVPTRLLDWSDSLLTAAWFAVQYPASGKDDVDAAIWVTRDIPTVSRLDFEPLGENGDRAVVYRPPHVAPRIGAQGSVLMVCPRPDQSVDLPVCGKIVIPRGRRFHLRKRLNACGMNSRALFADLNGLGDHLAWLFENRWLATAGRHAESQEDAD
jgi:FRG domain